MCNTNSILLVDDHPIVRSALIPIIDAIPNTHLIGQAENGEEGLNKAILYSPQLVIADIEMPKMNGVEMIKKIKSNSPDTKVIFITSHSDLFTFEEALSLDVDGYIFKENAMKEIRSCIDAVLQNEKFTCEKFKQFIQINQKKIDGIRKNKLLVTQLTKTELEVLGLISKGKSSPQIADQLFKSIKTIENHRYNICKKLEVTGNNQLLTFAVKQRKILAEFMEADKI
ncbi:response regulator transcription factor [Flammeovirga sp. EKP202]|uniref:response regulator transcription factor n=1 Tax=Flammeovirga sp. EKP202 TaxID=2770592 RepID=UPI00165F0F76|nr:response regulator transcription factor [Flammeovirga sp. EKP202]MBD0403641.1 response regulator transcription factor [Flammeovirga sp. EKP202]